MKMTLFLRKNNKLNYLKNTNPSLAKKRNLLFLKLKIKKKSEVKLKV